MHRVETTKARIELSMETLLGEMHNDFSNFSILMKTYAHLCKEVAEEPEKRVDYWTNKTN